jgi:hypothetical protein
LILLDSVDYLGSSSIDIDMIPQIGNEELFNDYLRHFNLNLQWDGVTNNQKRIISLKNDIESEFGTFCDQNDIPVDGDIFADTHDKIPIKQFVKCLINLPNNDSFERILNNRLIIETYPNESIIKFNEEENSQGNISTIYQGSSEPETQNIFNRLREYVMNQFTNISKLKEIEGKQRSDINTFRQAIEKTLYLHILPTNVQCPFLKLG